MSDTPHHNATMAAKLPALHSEPSKSMTHAQITLGPSAQRNKVYPQDESPPITLASVIQALRAHALESTSIDTTPVLDEPVHERIAYGLHTPDADDSYAPRFECFVNVDKGKSRAVEDGLDAPDALCSPSTTLSSIDTFESFESNSTPNGDDDIVSMLLIQQMLAEEDQQLALLLFEEEAMTMSPSYADFATKSHTSPQDRQTALTRLALVTELAAPSSLIPIASTSQPPPGVTPLSDEEYEINKKRILKEIDEEIARAEKKKRRQSEAARRRRNRNRNAGYWRSWSV